MAAGQKFQQFVEDLTKKVHNLSTDVLKIMLTNTAPSVANLVKTDITEIAAGNGYTAGGYTLAGQSSEQVAGVLTFSGNNVVATASGGAMAAWRYAVLYNDTAALKQLISFWDRGASVTLNSGESETLNTGTSLFTLT